MNRGYRLARRAAMALLILAACLCWTTPRVLALATEQFGNAPLTSGFPDLNPDVTALANLKSRFYWYEVNGNPTFFYQGNTDALNEALQKFAAIDGKTREVILLPGPGKGHSLGGDKTFSYDWSVNIPGGFHRPDDVPTMTVYVAAAAPKAEPDTKQLKRWLADLDSDAFAVRNQARRELEKLGHDAGPFLREALAAKPSVEAGRTIESLLGALHGVDVRVLKLPKGVEILEVQDLLARYRRELKGKDGTERGYAASALGGLARSVDVVPDLIEVLKNDRHEFARRSAAGALSRLGKAAAPALPLLKAGLDDPDVNVRNAYEYAIKQIEGAEKKQPSADDDKRRQALLEGISAFCKTLLSPE